MPLNDPSTFSQASPKVLAFLGSSLMGFVFLTQIASILSVKNSSEKHGVER